jgi:uncharacterized 2Fe-2S/4Fe-4S cluster protein (DUF4445 family)
MALFNRHHRRRATTLARRLRVLELSLRTDFQDLFVAHTVLAGKPASSGRQDNAMRDDGWAVWQGG